MSYSGSVYSRVVVEVLISGIDLSLWKIYEAGKRAVPPAGARAHSISWVLLYYI